MLLVFFVVSGVAVAGDTITLTETPARGPRHGLYLQIEPSGGRYWRFNYRFNGKQKTLALGVYPDVSLAKARRRLREEKGTHFLRQFSRSG